MKNTHLSFSKVLLATVIAMSTSALAKTKVLLVGDSTVATYSSGEKQGWGAKLKDHAYPDTFIVNKAAGGRSSKTFLSEGLWAKALQENPHYILIQFGHNDQNKDKVSVSSFKANITKMITDAKKKNIIPILVTPTHRLKFMSSKKLSTELTPYSEAMKDLAETHKIDTLDLHVRSENRYVTLGERESLKLFVKNDRTHTNIKGASELAQIVRDEAKKIKDFSDLFK